MEVHASPQNNIVSVIKKDRIERSHRKRTLKKWGCLKPSADGFNRKKKKKKKVLLEPIRAGLDGFGQCLTPSASALLEPICNFKHQPMGCLKPYVRMILSTSIFFFKLLETRGWFQALGNGVLFCKISPFGWCLKPSVLAQMASSTSHGGNLSKMIQMVNIMSFFFIISPYGHCSKHHLLYR